LVRSGPPSVPRVDVVEPVELRPEPFVARRPGASAESVIDVPRRAAGISDFGKLARLVGDASVTDIFVNGPRAVWADRGSGLERQPEVQFDAGELRELAVHLVAAGGRHIDEANPCVDTRLHDGMRVHAVLSPISTSGTLLSIRLPNVTPFSVADLELAGVFDVVPVEHVLDLIQRRANLLITGAGGSGKTTFLGALLGESAHSERIVAIEDVAELRVRHPHFISLEARQANLEGAGGLDLARLLREALRMRPDRLVLGECRGAEIRELLGALNTGHDGGAGTMHANSLDDVPARLEALGALAGLTPMATARQAVSAIGAVLHLERVDGVRRVAQLGTLALDRGDRLVVVRA
jgi:pilus assembly protein CpaF